MHARFYCMQFIYSSRYLPGAEFTEIQLSTQPRDNNVFFVQMCSLDSVSKQKNYRLIVVRALVNLDIGKELYIDWLRIYFPGITNSEN